MDISSSWDGTISPANFSATARAFCESWRVNNPAFPSWTWVPCSRLFGVASYEVEGYLSLENFYRLRFNEDDYRDGDCVGKELSNCHVNEESTDDATLVHGDDQELHFYDFHIVYSPSYRVPVLYFRGYYHDGQPLALDDIEKELPPNSLKMLRDSKWTFMTQEEHPYLNRPWYKLHPCGTGEWMKLLFLGEASLTKSEAIIQQYLVSWLSVVGQAVGLQVPIQMLNKSA